MVVTDRQQRQGERQPRNRASEIRFWAIVIALSGAGSILSVRRATPLFLDESTTALLLFFIIPAAVILFLGRLQRRAGVTLAVLLPFLWLLAARARSDSLLLWFIPMLTGLLIMLAARIAPARRAGLAATFISLLVGLGMLFWPEPGRPAYGPRLLLVGIDGASWVRIDPMISARKLPHFARLLDQSHRAQLRSLPSLYSPRIWSSIATGCPPAVHGIQDFGNKQSDFKVGRIWDQLRLEGRSFGTCGWYFTWPPLLDLGQNDFIVPSFLAPDDQAFPPEYSFFWQLQARERQKQESTMPLAQAGLRALRHGVRLSTLRRCALNLIDRAFRHRAHLDNYWRSKSLNAAIQAEIFAELIRTRRPEFAAVLFTEVDKISHRYWKYIQPEGFPDVTDEDLARYSETIDNIYAEIDRCLGKIIASAPRDADLLIVSDHGFRAASKRLGGKYCRIRTENLIRALGLEESLFGTNVDQKVFLRAISPSEAEREGVLARVRAVLSAAHISGETRALFGIVRERESILLTIARRNPVDENAYITMDGQDHPLDDLIRTIRGKQGGAGFSGEHHPDGIYILAGPSVARCSSADSLHVLDVAPTIAALLGLPVSPSWTGRPALEGLSLDRIEIAEYPPPSAPAAAPVHIDEALKEKLRAIGYLD